MNNLEKVLEEIMKIINNTIPAKVKRALLRDKLGLSEESSNELCPYDKADY